MKFKYIIIPILLLIIAACAEFEDDALDFSNSFPQYVELSSGAEIESVEGSRVSFTVRMRETQPTAVNIDYTVSGDATASGTITIDATSLSSSGSFVIPENDALGTGGMATITLTAVDNGLDLGRGGPDAGFSAVTRIVSWAEDLKRISFVSADTVESIEGATTKLLFIVNSLNAADSDLSISYTVSGDLTEGVDFNLDSPNPIVLDSGATADTIEIMLTEDFDNGVFDDGRNIFITLDAVTGGNAETALDTVRLTTGYAIADDTITVGFAADSVVVGDSTTAGVGLIDIPVSIDGTGFDHDDLMVVNYSIAGGAAGVDYEDVTGGSITFSNELSEAIRIRLLNEDDDLEFTVTLTGSDNPEAIIATESDEFRVVVDN